MLFEKAKTWPIPIETCKNYLAKNPEKFVCAKDQICHTNTPSGEKFFPQYASVSVESWGRVRGHLEMKNALKEGPLVCDFEVTPEFVKYGYMKDKS